MKYLMLLLLGLSLASCVNPPVQSGYSFEGVDLKRIIIGMNKAQVKSELGTSSIVDIADPNTWLYTSFYTKKIMFFPAKPVSQKIMKIHFNDEENIDSITFYQLSDTKNILMAQEETNVLGNKNKMNILDELLKNFGRMGESSAEK